MNGKYSEEDFKQWAKLRKVGKTYEEIAQICDVPIPSITKYRDVIKSINDGTAIKKEEPTMIVDSGIDRDDKFSGYLHSLLAYEYTKQTKDIWGKSSLRRKSQLHNKARQLILDNIYRAQKFQRPEYHKIDELVDEYVGFYNLLVEQELELLEMRRC